jgi:hypothetical protein
MGKGSSLRQPAEEKQYVPNGNGKRKEWDNKRTLFDPERCPDGVNADIWHLALFFRDTAAQYGYVLRYVSPPVVHGYLQKALTNLSPPDILARARTTGIDTTVGTTVWIGIVERAIIEFFTSPLEDYYEINEFSSLFKFEFYIQTAIDIIKHEDFITKAKRIPQPDTILQPSKRTAEQQQRHEILNREYTEQERLEKMKDFRSRNK